jgi:hypothetical protein
MPGGYGIGTVDGVDYTGRKISMPTCCPCIGSFGAGGNKTSKNKQRGGSWR